MKYSQNTWNQLKNLTKDKLISALLNDGFELDENLKTERVYRHHDGRKVIIHYHKGSETFGRNLLRGILLDIGWSESYMRRLKLIK